jgi:hypothetical protein
MDRDLFIKHFEGDGKLWATYTYLAMNVNWSDETFLYSKKGDDYEVKKGELMTTYNVLSTWLGFNYRTLKCHLARLKSRGLISLKQHKNCMRIVFLQHTDQLTQQSKCGGESNVGANTNKEYKKIRIKELKNKEMENKARARAHTRINNNSAFDDSIDSEGTKNIFDDAENAKNVLSTAINTPGSTLALIEPKKPLKAKLKPQAKKIKLSPKEIELGQRWFDATMQRVTSPYKSWSAESFAQTLAKVRIKSREPMSDQNLERVVNFCIEDFFWSKNCQSPNSLLKRNKDGVLRLDVILNQLITKSEMRHHRINNMTITENDVRELDPFL